MNDYSWKERFNDVIDIFASMWNSSLNYIAENYGEKALSQYCRYAFSSDVIRFPISLGELKSKGVGETLKKRYLPALYKIHGSKIRIKDIDKDKIVIEISKCRTKSMLTKKNKNPKYYCWHCSIPMPLWEELGLINEVKKRGDSSCIRTIRRISTQK